VQGSDLKRIRLRLGWTQEKMAQRLDISRNSIGRYETGRRRIERVLEIAVRCLASHQSRR